MRRFTLALSFGYVILMVAACNKPSNPGTAQSGPANQSKVTKDTTPDGPPSAGRTVYDTQGCARCHTPGSPTASGPPAGGPGGGGPGGGGPGKGMKGPDLAQVGGKHDKEWLMAHVRDAKSHKPMSRMPAFPEDKLNAKDLSDLGDFLLGLK